MLKFIVACSLAGAVLVTAYPTDTSQQENKIQNSNTNEEVAAENAQLDGTESFSSNSNISQTHNFRAYGQSDFNDRWNEDSGDWASSSAMSRGSPLWNVGSSNVGYSVEDKFRDSVGVSSGGGSYFGDNRGYDRENHFGRSAPSVTITSRIVIQKYTSFASQMGAVCAQISTGNLDSRLVYQRLQWVASNFQSLFVQTQRCSRCFNFGGANGYRTAMSQVFQQFYQIIIICQQKHQSTWQTWFNELFQPLSNSFQIFFKFCIEKGISVTSFITDDYRNQFSKIGISLTI